MPKRKSDIQSGFPQVTACSFDHLVFSLVQTKLLVQLSFATVQQNEYGTYSRVVSATGTSCGGMSILN